MIKGGSTIYQPRHVTRQMERAWAKPGVSARRYPGGRLFTVPEVDMRGVIVEKKRQRKLANPQGGG